MARRRSMYGKKRKIKYGRILFLVLLLAALIALISLLFRKNEYIGVIDEVLNSDIKNISGTLSSVSDVDIKVYSNDGIRYTNQHEDIKKLISFDGTRTEDLDKSGNAKLLLENLYKSKKGAVIDDLPLKKDGYYWLDTTVVVKNEKLFFSDEEEYNFDMYYDKEDKKVYTKEEYFNEFSTKNNGQKFQEYEATEEFIRIIEEFTK